MTLSDLVVALESCRRGQLNLRAWDALVRRCRLAEDYKEEELVACWVRLLARWRPRRYRSRKPRQPCHCLPGSEPKIRTLMARAEAGLELFHPDDVTDDERLASLPWWRRSGGHSRVVGSCRETANGPVVVTVRMTGTG